MKALSDYDGDVEEVVVLVRRLIGEFDSTEDFIQDDKDDATALLETCLILLRVIQNEIVMNLGRA